MDYNVRSHVRRSEDKDVVLLFFSSQAYPAGEPAFDSTHGIMP
jgi:hypothetical protein